jgi:nucleoside-specific outer membrane channel protein Tsx
MQMFAPRSTRTAAAAVLSAISLLAAPRRAAAQDVHIANVQVLHGAGFRDATTGEATADGRMTTVTVESYGTWRYGDNFFFVDLTSGDFVDGAGTPSAQRHRLYGEWAPRLSLSKVTGRRVGAGPVLDLYLAGQLNRGSGFNAYLIGLSTNLRLPGFALFELGAYARDDNFNRPTYQVTGVWLVPVRLGPVPVSLGGFVDVSGTDALGVDVMTQPQLLVDLGAVALRAPNRLQVGFEWRWHRNDAVSDDALQALAKWTW